MGFQQVLVCSSDSAHNLAHHIRGRPGRHNGHLTQECRAGARLMAQSRLQTHPSHARMASGHCAFFPLGPKHRMRPMQWGTGASRTERQCPAEAGESAAPDVAAADAPEPNSAVAWSIQQAGSSAAVLEPTEQAPRPEWLLGPNQVPAVACIQGKRAAVRAPCTAASPLNEQYAW